MGHRTFQNQKQIFCNRIEFPDVVGLRKEMTVTIHCDLQARVTGEGLDFFW